MFDLTHEQYDEKIHVWDEKDAAGPIMPEEELKAAIDGYIKANDTFALATGSDGYVRCTPIEYIYFDGVFWLFSEGGKKFIGLEKNKKVSAALFEKFSGWNNLKGLQIQGTAQIVEPMSEEYMKACGEKKIPAEALKNMPRPLNIIKIVPDEMLILDAAFKEKGYASRQTLKCCNT